MTTASKLLAALLATMAITAAAVSQMDPAFQQDVAVSFDSGAVTNETSQRGVIFSQVVIARKAPWMRLVFDQATLGAAPAGGEPTILVLTSMEDGAVQHLDAQRLQEWQYTSAYFNGDMVLVEIVADPGARSSRISGSRVWAGSPFLIQQFTICGPVDDRELSEDARVARIWPNGCTAFLIDDANGCLLTAGHCTGGSGFDIIEFNVPVSDSDGSANHPPPSEQYTIDQTSLQTNGGQGIGNDWGYFGAFSNTQTGLTPSEAQGTTFVMADPPSVSGQDIRITGHGTTSWPVPGSFNRAQKTHTGPYASFFGSTVQYTTDTTGGNSGSPVINDETGEVIGIHTHGGCGLGGGENSGTGLNNFEVQNALANPQGVCIPLGPANDDCAGAELVLASIDAAFTTIDSSTDGFDESACVAGGVENDVWFRHIVTCDGTLTIGLEQLDFAARMTVYTGFGCPDAPNQAIACIQTPDETSVSFAVTVGEGVRIRIGCDDEVGNGVLAVTCDEAASCPEDCADPGDGAVTVVDLLAMLGQWGTSGSCAISGENNVVDVSDLLQLLGAFGSQCE